MQDQVIIVPTAQNIELIYPIASVGDRVKAYLIDLICIIGYYLFFFYVLDVGNNDVLGILFSIPILTYSLVCELLLGEQSVGKKLIGLKVIRVNGKRPGFSAIMLRWLSRFLDVTFLWLPGGDCHRLVSERPAAGGYAGRYHRLSASNWPPALRTRCLCSRMKPTKCAFRRFAT